MLNLSRPPWHDYVNEVNDIKNTNPDEIIVDCVGEFDYKLIFQNFIKNIQPWLEENNKFAKIIIPYDDDLYITPNITTERYMGIPVQFLYQLTQRTNLKRHPIEQNQKLFTFYNNNPKVERAILLDKLVKENLLHSGIVTFRYPEQVTSQTARPFKWEYHDGSRLYDEEDFELNSKVEYLADNLPKSYFNGLIDIVAETSVEGHILFISEKTTRPLSVLKPFLVLSARNFHTKLLRDHYGLELYTEMFDYSFDDCDLLEDRMNGIVDNLKHLQKLLSDQEARNNMYDKIHDKLIYNREVMLKMLDNEDRMVAKSLKFLLTSSDYELLGDKTDTWMFSSKFLLNVKK